jgi:hypothetical protein
VVGAIGSHPQLSTDAWLRASEQGKRLLLCGKDPIDDRKQVSTVWRQLYAAFFPFEQSNTISLLQCFDLRGQSRLAHARALGGAGETAGMGDNMEGAEFR